MERYVLIYGGGFLNKGAQSMTFAAINEIKRRFPNKQIVLLSEASYNTYKNEKDLYNFDILPMNIGINFILMGGLYKIVWNLKANKSFNIKYQKVISDLQYIIKKTDAIIDISGFTLSSQRGKGAQILYLFMLKLAKQYEIKYYLMPQSFGPFEYKGTFKYLINYLIKRYMPYPEVVYAREKEGYDLLTNHFGLKNVKLSLDLVLLNKNLEITNIYRKLPKFINFNGVNGVAIIPNMRNFDHGNIEQILCLYERVINKLNNMGKTVYLIRHSFEDIEACELIKGRFSNNEQVMLITEDMSCLEFDELVKSFDFLIASRFHSIVHAYKNGVPCIALGWATKYHELLKVFRQNDYIFDVREDNDVRKVEEAVDQLLERYMEESKTILSILKELQLYNVFDVIEEK